MEQMNSTMGSTTAQLPTIGQLREEEVITSSQNIGVEAVMVLEVSLEELSPSGRNSSGL